MDEGLRRFVERVAGGPLTRAERTLLGSSRATWLLEAAGKPLVLRVDAGEGPVAGTELSLAREATVYAALRDAPVRMPRLVAVTPERDALLMERVPGDSDFKRLGAASREALMDDYVDALAELHAVHAEGLHLPGIAQAATAAQCATNELALWGGILDARVERAAPLARFALRWLERCVPERVERPVLCHGDVGPGNFLFEDGRVTALLDWEFAHVGDPMDDLAALAFRGHHMEEHVGDFDAQLRRWSGRTGLPVDRHRIAYYRAFLMTRWLISCLAALDSGAKMLDRSVHLLLIPALEALLPRAMAQFDRAPRGAPAGLRPDRANALTETLDVISEDLSSRIATAVSSAEATHRLERLQLLLLYARALAGFGDDLFDREVEEIAKLVGRPFAERSAARSALEAFVRASPSSREGELLDFFLRQGERAIAGCPPMGALASKPLLDLEH